MTRPPGDHNPDLVNDPVSADGNSSGELRADPERRRLQRRLFQQPRMEALLDPSRPVEPNLTGGGQSVPRPERSLRDRPQSSSAPSKSPFGYFAMPRADDDLFSRSPESVLSKGWGDDAALSVEGGAADQPIPSIKSETEIDGAFASQRETQPRTLPQADFEIADPSPISDAAKMTASMHDVMPPSSHDKNSSLPIDHVQAPEIPSWLKTTREPLRPDSSRMPQMPRPGIRADRTEPPLGTQSERSLADFARFDPDAESEAETTLPTDIRVTRDHPTTHNPMPEDRRRNRRPVLDRDTLADRVEPRFDSSSDEAVTAIDPTVPPLVDDPFISTRRIANFERTYRDRSVRASTDDPSRSGDARLDARYVIESIHGKVDEERVARAEARFKPTAPTVEDLISQSRSDEMEEIQSFMDETYVDPQWQSEQGPSLASRIAKRINIFKRSSSQRVEPPIQRTQRRRRQSRLYEDIVAWIVVPPFIIGAIYGVIEASKFISNSPLGKLLSGQ